MKITIVCNQVAPTTQKHDDLGCYTAIGKILTEARKNLKGPLTFDVHITGDLK